MATFNSSNGCIMGSTKGTVCPLDPKYRDVLSELPPGGIIKSVGQITINGPLHVPATAVSSNVPAVQFWSFPDMNTTAVVYTDASGNSSFSYKNDPQGVIQLIPGGSQAVPPTQIQSTATASSQEGSGIIGFVCWCLSCISSIIFIIGCVTIIMAALKRSSGPQPSTPKA